MTLGACLEQAWAKRGLMAVGLLPLAGLFRALVFLRRTLYRFNLLPRERLPVPVIVVGSIMVGGIGKTPLTLWLVNALRRQGLKPGIVSRGYGGDGELREVAVDSSADCVGDEPLLLKRRAQVPVFVGPDRVKAARALIATHPDCQLIVADDGLQHYRLHRDFEIAVVDERGLMNGWPLPAGPLREPRRRLDSVNAVVIHGAMGPDRQLVSQPARFTMQLAGERFYDLHEPQRTCTAAELTAGKLAAVAGIGHPERFFGSLQRLGLTCTWHRFPDHHRFTRDELDAIPADALLMTEKDAVKCAGLTNRPVWVLPVTAEVEPDLAGLVLETLYGRSSARNSCLPSL